MSYIYVGRPVKTRLNFGGEFSVKSNRLHATLAEPVPTQNIDLETSARIVREAPQSAANNLIVYPQGIVRVGQKAQTASLAIDLANNQQLIDEMIFYQDQLGAKISTPHITVARAIPYDSLDSERHRLEDKLTKYPKIELRGACMRSLDQLGSIATRDSVVL